MSSKGAKGRAMKNNHPLAAASCGTKTIRSDLNDRASPAAPTRPGDGDLFELVSDAPNVVGF